MLIVLCCVDDDVYGVVLMVLSLWCRVDDDLFDYVV